MLINCKNFFTVHIGKIFSFFRSKIFMIYLLFLICQCAYIVLLIYINYLSNREISFIFYHSFFSFRLNKSIIEICKMKKSLESVDYLLRFI